jgi:hypothetical protein
MRPVISFSISFLLTPPQPPTYHDRVSVIMHLTLQQRISSLSVRLLIVKPVACSKSVTFLENCRCVVHASFLAVSPCLRPKWRGSSCTRGKGIMAQIPDETLEEIQSVWQCCSNILNNTAFIDLFHHS